MTAGIFEVPLRPSVDDVTADDDTAYVQHHVELAKAAGGGIIYLAPGTWVFSENNIALDGDDLIVRGAGFGTKIRARKASKFAFLVTGARCAVEDLLIDCETVGEGGVHFSAASEPRAERLRIARSVDEAIKGSGSVAAHGVLKDIYIPSGAVGVEFASTFTNMSLINVDAEAATRPFNLGTGAGHTVQGRAGGLLYRTVKLTDTQIKALRATPQTLVPSPGAGLAVIPVYAHLFLDVTTAGYSESADNLVIEYAGGTDAISIETTGFIDQSTDQARFIGIPEALFTPVAAEALQLFNNGDGEFGSGNAANTLTVRVYYFVVPMAAGVAD